MTLTGMLLSWCRCCTMCTAGCPSVRTICRWLSMRSTSAHSEAAGSFCQPFLASAAGGDPPSPPPASWSLLLSPAPNYPAALLTRYTVVVIPSTFTQNLPEPILTFVLCCIDETRRYTAVQTTNGETRLPLLKYLCCWILLFSNRACWT